MYWWNKKTTIASISLMLLIENGIYIDNVLVEQKDNNPFYRSYVTDRKCKYMYNTVILLTKLFLPNRTLSAV